MSFDKICRRINWPSLHEKKKEIFEYDMDNDLAIAIDEVLKLFDTLQDEAERLGLWQFPEESEVIQKFIETFCMFYTRLELS